MRVRGSAGLKLASELSENGSAVIETASSATALVEDDETVNKEGEIAGAAKVSAAQVEISKPAKLTKAATLPEANARIVIQ
jgi:hypothetical protein